MISSLNLGAGDVRSCSHKFRVEMFIFNIREASLPVSPRSNRRFRMWSPKVTGFSGYCGKRSEGVLLATNLIWQNGTEHRLFRRDFVSNKRRASQFHD